MKHLIVGMGKSGRSALRFLLQTGTPRQDILTFDDKDPSADAHDPAEIPAEYACAKMILSPGYPLRTPWISDSLQRGMTLSSEISLALSYLSTEKIIGITGSVGKSTTAALLAEGAGYVDTHVFLGGNFGVPLCDYVTDVLENRRRRAGWIILELSSFQLENPGELKVDLAVITSLAPNHLERYPSKDEYYRTKLRLLDLCRGPVILNKHGGELPSFLPSPRNRDCCWVSPEDSDLIELHLEESPLIGSHNLENLAVAARTSLLAGWPTGSIERMKRFRGLPHRLENLSSRRGVIFVNDSKSTTIESTLSAVKSCLQNVPSESPLFVLVGGRDKNLPWEKLASLKDSERVRPVFFGECRLHARQVSGLEGPEFGELSQAVQWAFSQSSPGSWVLLSPGGTSLDAFKSFEDRGDTFRKIVATLPET